MPVERDRQFAACELERTLTHRAGGQEVGAGDMNDALVAEVDQVAHGETNAAHVVIDDRGGPAGFVGTVHQHDRRAVLEPFVGDRVVQRR